MCYNLPGRRTDTCRAAQVTSPVRKEMCFFSSFKRHLQRHRELPSSSWRLYTNGFAGGRSGRHGGGRGAGRGRRAAQKLSRRGIDVCQAAGRLSFEACPFYLGEVSAAAMIHRVFPELQLVAILRNPRERTVSAFNDYVRMGRIHGSNATADGMEALVRERIALLRSGKRTLESYDMRILTSGAYIHGLEAWGRTWPTSQLLVLQSEDLFADTRRVMERVHAFLRLRPRQADEWQVSNKNTMRSRSRASRALNETLDAFFAPYNERLYEWAALRGVSFRRWENASHD